MLVLRNARPEDVETFEHFYTTYNYEVLYGCAEDTTSELTSNFTEEKQSHISDGITEVTIETFFKILDSNDEEIFIVESDNSPIGVIYTSLIKRRIAKVYSLCLAPTFEYQIPVIFKLLLKRYSQLSICATSPHVCKILEEEMLAEKGFKSLYYIKRPE